MSRRHGSRDLEPFAAEALDVVAAVRGFRRVFRAAGRPERAAQEKRYLKSPLDFHGVDLPTIRRTARSFWREHRALGRTDLLCLVAALWETRYHDLRALGVALLERYQELLQETDLGVVEHLLRHSGTWALVDWLAVHIAGGLVERHPDATAILRRWAQDEDLWLRRAALLALLHPLRRGGGDFALFTELAVPMLEERGFFIRKAIGWVLREVGKKRPELVQAFLSRYLGRLSGLTLREAAKILPPAEREALLSLRKSGPPQS